MTFILNEGKERKFEILISKFENKIFCPHQSNLSGWSGDTTTGKLQGFLRKSMLSAGNKIVWSL